MCGIAGFWCERSTGIDMIATVRRMTNAIRNRGPDDEGVWCDVEASVALGHRRLSVLDLSPQAHQPMQSHTGRFSMVFNGEIYNFRVLKEELCRSSFSFRSTSDTEVMLAAFEHWGVAQALPKFVGMFAFAVWDRSERTLYLGRDRFGEKPLYYGWMGGTLLFGSELKALREHPHWDAQIDRDVLALFIQYGYVPAPYSIYRSVQKLEPGSILAISRQDGHVRSHKIQYWSPREMVESGAQFPFDGDDEEAVSAFDTLLKRTVRQQMISDVPLGAFLSGGIDSSAIVAIMQSESSRPIKTFTVAFNEREYDEANHARGIANSLGTDHSELRLTPGDALAIIPKLPTLYDEPFADPSQIPTFLVSQFARRDVTVALSGDGGDELLGGYDRYVWGDRLWSGLAQMPQRLRAVLAVGLTAVSSQSWDRINRFGSSTIPRSYRVVSMGEKTHKLASMLKAKNATGVYRDLLSICHDSNLIVIGGSPAAMLQNNNELPAAVSEDFFSTGMYLDLMGFLPDDILVKVDRASMGVSLETRAPLLDHRVAEFCWRLPRRFKIRGAQRKWLLRKVLARYLPAIDVDRPKMGFAMPLAAWLRGPLRPWADTMIESSRLREEGFLNARLVHERWYEHLSARNDCHRFLWNILMFQAWLERQ
jgi:asparagine synthase (glutamine-hydrolysing)